MASGDTQPDNEAISGTWSERGQDMTFRAALWSARRLPYARRVPWFGSLARRLSGGPLPYRQRMLENLDYVWPDLPEARRREIADQAADNAGRTMIEHYSMGELAQRLAATPPTGPGYEILKATRAENRPVIILTGHYSNHETLWISATGQGIPLGGFYRPLSNPYMNRHYVDTVKALGSGPLFSQDRAGMGRLMRYLRGGGGVVMLNDLYVGMGVEMDFLGKPAMTGLTAADLALRLDAPLLPAFSTRLADGLSFRIEIGAPIPHSDPETMTAAYTRSLEARILADPGQWFWAHRRWKRKWNKGQGAAPDLHPAAMPTRQRNG
jgi:KDO2-lipid IV(A) lauroyltransferase